MQRFDDRLRLQLFYLVSGLFLSLAKLANASECEVLYEQHTSEQASPEIEFFALELARASKISLNELHQFLIKSGVLVQAEHSDLHRRVVVLPSGDHPLNRLAKIYAEDGVQLVFDPILLGSRRARGSYDSRKKIVYLEAVGSNWRTTRGFLTTTDLHELLHARLSRDGQATYVRTIIRNGGVLEPRLDATGYGDSMSLSELVTFRQDLRLILGKLKQWSKQQSLPQPNWLSYFWPARKTKRPVESIERVDTLIDRLSSKLKAIEAFEQLISKVLAQYGELLNKTIQSDSRPLHAELTQNRIGDARFPRVRIVLRNQQDPTQTNDLVMIEFSVSGEKGSVDWNIARNDIRSQLEALSRVHLQSQSEIRQLKTEIKSLSSSWLTWRAERKGLEQLSANILSAHERSKRLHQIALDGI
jgi:hypothetical protein